MSLPSERTPGPDHRAPEYDEQTPVDLDPPRYAIEPKVKASAGAGAGAAAIITPAVVLAVDELFYGGGAIDVPLPYVGVIGLVVTGLSALAAGYYARHVERLPAA